MCTAVDIFILIVSTEAILEDHINYRTFWTSVPPHSVRATWLGSGAHKALCLVMEWQCRAALLESCGKGWAPPGIPIQLENRITIWWITRQSCSCQTHTTSMEVTDSLQHINRFGCQECLCSSAVWSLEHITPQKQGYKWRLSSYVLKLRGYVTCCIF